MEGFESKSNTQKHFEFGDNWRDFSNTIDEQKIVRAENSLREMLGQEELKGLSFLDIGCGSGLFSLAAVRLGAAKVFSLDYDAQSVTTAAALKNRYFKDSAAWTIEQGDALNSAYMSKLGEFDVVYSWGVLHHTGNMWQALENAAGKVKAGGKLFIAIYNDQGRKSFYWKIVKKMYNFMPGIFKYVVLIPAFVRIWAPPLLKDTLKGAPLKRWKEYAGNRGMSPWHDVVDWVGGYPFEVAKPSDITSFYKKFGFELIKSVTCGNGYGNNEFVFKRIFDPKQS